MSAGLASVRLPGSDGPILAVHDGERLLPLEVAARAAGERHSVPTTLRSALGDWARWSAVVVAAAAGDHTTWMRADELLFLPAVDDPLNVYCAGANYYDHIEEMGAMRPDKSETRPFHFLASTGALSGHRCEVVRPAGCTRFDWEVELAVVIARDATAIPAARAEEVIAGYTVANDLSMRDFARRSDSTFFPDWLESKCHPGCLPLGPSVVPASLISDPMKLGLSLTVNGDRKQASSTERMIFSVFEQIEYLSRVATLRAGDVIITGTPAGTGIASGAYLNPGDRVVAEVESVGRLETTIVESR